MRQGLSRYSSLGAGGRTPPANGTPRLKRSYSEQHRPAHMGARCQCCPVSGPGTQSDCAPISLLCLVRDHTRLGLQTLAEAFLGAAVESLGLEQQHQPRC